MENEYGPGKSWNLLGSDADCGHNDAGCWSWKNFITSSYSNLFIWNIVV